MQCSRGSKLPSIYRGTGSDHDMPTNCRSPAVFPPQLRIAASKKQANMSKPTNGESP